MMKVVMWMAVGMVMMGMAWAEPEDGPQVFPGQEDAMLRKLMGEMLKEAEDERKEMEKPVELPQLDAPELRHLFKGMREGSAIRLKRWMLGVSLKPDGNSRLVVADVMEGSPAAKAGLKRGDEVRDVNGIRLRDHVMLVELLQVVRDQELVLGVVREGKDVQVEVTPAQLTVPAGGVAAPGGKPDDAVLEELRGMRQLMEEMLQELKKQSPMVRRVPKLPPSRSGTRQVPTPPQN